MKINIIFAIKQNQKKLKILPAYKNAFRINIFESSIVIQNAKYFEMIVNNERTELQNMNLRCNRMLIKFMIRYNNMVNTIVMKL